MFKLTISLISDCPKQTSPNLIRETIDDHLQHLKTKKILSLDVKTEYISILKDVLGHYNQNGVKAKLRKAFAGIMQTLG